MTIKAIKEKYKNYKIMEGEYNMFTVLRRPIAGRPSVIYRMGRVFSTLKYYCQKYGELVTSVKRSARAPYLFKDKGGDQMKRNDNWHEGTIGLNDDGLAHFWVKSFETGSEYGINGGRISKLTIKINGATVANYDRGWDVEPDLTSQAVALAYSIILDSYN